MSDSAGGNSHQEEKQCRICLDGSEAEHEMGRLIRPCLCKGSISVRSHALTMSLSPKSDFLEQSMSM